MNTQKNKITEIVMKGDSITYKQLWFWREIKVDDAV